MSQRQGLWLRPGVKPVVVVLGESKTYTLAGPLKIKAEHVIVGSGSPYRTPSPPPVEPSVAEPASRRSPSVGAALIGVALCIYSLWLILGPSIAGGLSIGTSVTFFLLACDELGP